MAPFPPGQLTQGWCSPSSRAGGGEAGDDAAGLKCVCKVRRTQTALMIQFYTRYDASSARRVSDRDGVTAYTYSALYSVEHMI